MQNNRRIQLLKEETSTITASAKVEGVEVPYRATAGNIIIKNDQGKPKGSIFYVSYIKEGVEDSKERPIVFCFNGGPGCAAVWMHLGAFGTQDHSAHRKRRHPTPLSSC